MSPRFCRGAARGNAVFPVLTGARRTQTAERASRRRRLRVSCADEAPRLGAVLGAGSRRRQGPGVAGCQLKRRPPTREIRGVDPRSASLTSSSVTLVTSLLWPLDRRRERLPTRPGPRWSPGVRKRSRTDHRSHPGGPLPGRPSLVPGRKCARVGPTSFGFLWFTLIRFIQYPID